MNVVVLPSGLPVTVIRELPVGVEPAVLIVSWLEQVGLHAPGLNDAVAALGSPDAENAALWGEPEVWVAVIVFEPAPPWVAVMLPEFVSV